jgi:hypothetical protein
VISTIYLLEKTNQFFISAGAVVSISSATNRVHIFLGNTLLVIAFNRKRISRHGKYCLRPRDEGRSKRAQDLSFNNHFFQGAVVCASLLSTAIIHAVCSWPFGAPAFKLRTWVATKFGLIFVNYSAYFPAIGTAVPLKYPYTAVLYHMILSQFGA